MKADASVGRGRYALHRTSSGTYNVQDANGGEWVSHLTSDRGNQIVVDWFGLDVLVAVLKHDYFGNVSRGDLLARYPEDFALSGPVSI